MSQPHTIVLMGAFICVVLAFSIVQLAVARSRTKRAEAEVEAAGAEMERFRDAVMVLVAERLGRTGLEVVLEPTTPLGFEVNSPADEVGVTVVLLNLYEGCSNHPERAEEFKAHFLDDLVRTISEARRG